MIRLPIPLTSTIKFSLSSPKATVSSLILETLIEATTSFLSTLVTWLKNSSSILSLFITTFYQHTCLKVLEALYLKLWCECRHTAFKLKEECSSVQDESLASSTVKNAVKFGKKFPFKHHARDYVIGTMAQLKKATLVTYNLEHFTWLKNLEINVIAPEELILKSIYP